MTRGQRRAHLAIWLILGPLTLAAVVAFAILRPERPVADSPAAETTP